MMTISYEIKSRGTMQIMYGDKKIIISGELVFNPPIFYADLISFRNWESPNESDTISEKEKNEIIEFIKSDSLNEGKTKIIFD